jgi:rubrerythrin
MDEFNAKEVVEMAIRTERLGAEYYRELAERFRDNKDFYELFSKLGEREIEHEKSFTKLKDSIGTEEYDGWADVSEYMRAYVQSAFFIGRDKALPHMSNIQNVNAAVRLALSFERETLLYFYGLRDGVEDKVIVDAIIQEEKGHIFWLSRYITTHGV